MRKFSIYLSQSVSRSFPALNPHTLDYVPKPNKEYTIMKKANKIITIEEIAIHFFNGEGIVSFFITRTNPKQKAAIIKITLTVLSNRITSSSNR